MSGAWFASQRRRKEEPRPPEPRKLAPTDIAIGAAQCDRLIENAKRWMQAELARRDEKRHCPPIDDIRNSAE